MMQIQEMFTHDGGTNHLVIGPLVHANLSRYKQIKRTKGVSTIDIVGIDSALVLSFLY